MTIDLSLSHQEIANMIGSTRETVSSNLQELTKQGLIMTGRLKISVNKHILIDLLVKADFNQKISFSYVYLILDSLCLSLMKAIANIPGPTWEAIVADKQVSIISFSIP